MLTMIDNYDSFTFNLVQYFAELGADVSVYRNDAVSVESVLREQPQQIVISPGPCDPEKAGISVELIRQVAGKIPLLGVCLGHQCIGAAYDGKIVPAGQIMHGKTSPVYHHNRGVFSGLPNPFVATRYHSLVVEKQSLPDCFEVTAWTQSKDGSIDQIMGMRHRELAVEGVQFHPESIMTEHGHDLLQNFLNRS